MSLEVTIGIAILRWVIFGYIVYRLVSKVNWPLAFYYMRGGDKA